MDGLRIRTATAEDSDFAYSVKKAAFREYAEKVWGWDEGHQRELHRARFASQDFRIIQFRGRDCGVMALAGKSDHLRLYQLYLLTEYQGQGIGSECMKVILQQAESERQSVRLQVLKVNQRAAAFYERLGFTEVGESATHIEMERAFE